MDNYLNLFWAIIWGLVLICTIAGLLGKIWPLVILAMSATGICVAFMAEYVRGKKK